MFSILQGNSGNVPPPFNGGNPGNANPPPFSADINLSAYTISLFIIGILIFYFTKSYDKELYNKKAKQKQ